MCRHAILGHHHYKIQTPICMEIPFMRQNLSWLHSLMPSRPFHLDMNLICTLGHFWVSESSSYLLVSVIQSEMLNASWSVWDLPNTTEFLTPKTSNNAICIVFNKYLEQTDLFIFSILPPLGLHYQNLWFNYQYLLSLPSSWTKTVCAS